MSMSRDWRDCGAIAFNVRTMMNKAILSRRCSTLIIAVYCTAVMVYVSVIMEFNSIVSDEPGKEGQQLFLKMKFPFVYDCSPIYEIVMFVQCVQLLGHASVIGMLDALIVTLVNFSLTLTNAIHICINVVA